ncbi:MAG: ThuA domain-containing protein [Planctomycetales bacterium]|nr:ThuA domain-containing protein [Planctomycetales bacterium]MBN8626687.1 ThuA domain-containing protein [Planctomycetota bacterium]
MRRSVFAVCFAFSICVSSIVVAEPLKVLIVDGQNNHNWQGTTPVMKKYLEESKQFTVDVATSPAKGQDMSGFKPDFAKYDVVLLNYNGDLWSKETRQALVDYVQGGGGLAVIHAANNSFGDWPEYNRMIGLGGWGGRNEKSGPYVRFRDGKIVRDESPGPGGHHGKQHPFHVTVRNADHPITRGMPASWLHAQDELYDKLRGPAEAIDVLATAYADPATGGSGEHEPMIFTVTYGKGRVFHTPMGHSPETMHCVGFITTLVRGCEWAATGDVKSGEVPKDFPKADAVSIRGGRFE